MPCSMTGCTETCFHYHDDGGTVRYPETRANAPSWEEWLAVPGTTFVFDVERGTIEVGKSFSADAVRAVLDQVDLYIGTRIMRRWAEANEPPTALSITVDVDVH